MELKTKKPSQPHNPPTAVHWASIGQRWAYGSEEDKAGLKNPGRILMRTPRIGRSMPMP